MKSNKSVYFSYNITNMEIYQLPEKGLATQEDMVSRVIQFLASDKVKDYSFTIMSEEQRMKLDKETIKKGE